MRLGRAAWLTDTGRRRMRNEDAYVFEPPLFAIADGMGGARAGEVAAGIATAALRDGRRDVMDEESLEAIIAEANRRVWERSVADPSTAGMGTTVTVALVDAPAEQIVFGHVGDSRAYRLRADALEQITTDHSLVAELVQSGVLTPEEAERHPQRSAITRAVGTERAIDVDVFTVPAELDDLFLLCSDGLTDMLSEDAIAATPRRCSSPRRMHAGARTTSRSSCSSSWRAIRQNRWTWIRPRPPGSSRSRRRSRAATTT